MFTFLFTSENGSDDALTEVNRIIPIQLHPKPAMGFANAYNVKDGKSDEQMVFMIQSIMNFSFLFLEGLISESGTYSLPNMYFKRINSATKTQAKHPKLVSDWLLWH